MQRVQAASLDGILVELRCPDERNGVPADRQDVDAAMSGFPVFLRCRRGADFTRIR